MPFLSPFLVGRVLLLTKKNGKKLVPFLVTSPLEDVAVGRKLIKPTDGHPIQHIPPRSMLPLFWGGFPYYNTLILTSPLKDLEQILTGQVLESTGRSEWGAGAAALPAAGAALLDRAEGTAGPVPPSEITHNFGVPGSATKK